MWNFSGSENEETYHVIKDGRRSSSFGSSKSRRSVAEGPVYSSIGRGGGGGGGGGAYDGGYGGYGGDTSLLVLAPRRTHRKDPLHGFNYYNGGWNISDRHYWAVCSSILYLFPFIFRNFHVHIFYDIFFG